jgi:hypothetical protein
MKFFKFKISIGRVALCVIFAFLVWIMVSPSVRSFSAKMEGSLTQQMYEKYKSKSISICEVDELNGQKFAVISTQEGNVVVMLAPKFSPYYRQMPDDVSYELTDEQFKKLNGIAGVSETVKNVFLSRVLRVK